MNHITIAVINIKSNGDAITEAAKPKIPEPSKPGSVKLTRSRRLNKKTTTSNSTGKQIKNDNNHIFLNESEIGQLPNLNLQRKWTKDM